MIFSFHEMALMDLPATIDYILSETRQMNLVYVGYSMGTTMSYILLSEKPEYNEKMRLVVSLAPVAYWRHVPEDLFRSIAAWVSFFYFYYCLQFCLKIFCFLFSVLGSIIKSLWVVPTNTGQLQISQNLVCEWSPDSTNLRKLYFFDIWK